MYKYIVTRLKLELHVSAEHPDGVRVGGERVGGEPEAAPKRVEDEGAAVVVHLETGHAGPGRQVVRRQRLRELQQLQLFFVVGFSQVFIIIV